MDHSWGRNIVDRFVASTWREEIPTGLPFPTLASRITIPHFGDYWLLNVRQGNLVLITGVLPDMETILIGSSGFITPTQQHFPYGWPVEPDVPL